MMLDIKERALSLEGMEENGRKGEQGCHNLSTLERDETSEHVIVDVTYFPSHMSVEIDW